MSLLHRVIALAVATLLTGCVSVPKYQSLPVEARLIQGGRDLHVAVPQGEIKSTIEVSNLTAAAQGGLLFALVDAGVNNHRAKVAEDAVKPLRDALVGYDFDDTVTRYTHATFAELDWFGLGKVTFGKSIDSKTVLSMLDQAATPQLAFVTWEYQATADFSAIEVTASVHIAPRALPDGAGGGGRLNPSNATYLQAHRVKVPLRGAVMDKNANIARWSANQGALARDALGKAIRQNLVMADKGLRISVEASKALAKQPKASSGTYAGASVEQTPACQIVWNPMTREWMCSLEPVG